MAVQGDCAPAFRAVRDEFERNFAERGDVGASVCVTLDGEPVVDLWGGLADPAARRPWQRDTIGLVFSSTKGAAALCAHMLIDRGLLDLDAPVASYWPEFAQAGKAEITVRQVLNHQAGLPAVRTPLRPGGLYDWDYIVQTLAAEEPLWPPGTRQGYHAATFGHLVGELVRRTTGRGLDRFFRDEVAEPLGLDFHIGLPEEHEDRVAPTTRPDPTPRGEPVSAFIAAMKDPQSIQALAWLNTGRPRGAREYDSPTAHRAVLPSQGGITNARGLAAMYAPLALGGEHNGVRIVGPNAVRRMGVVSSALGVDAVLLIGLRFALGFWKSSDNRGGPPGARDSVILSEEGFGHPGMGGSIGFADPGARLSFGYTMNKQGRGVCLNERGQSLVDATYRALGYRPGPTGSWVR